MQLSENFKNREKMKSCVNDRLLKLKSVLQIFNVASLNYKSVGRMYAIFINYCHVGAGDEWIGSQPIVAV